ncbi:prepilin-type N-terminal cleavage/methylation domain-containing protein [Nostoc sp. FACHB-892]|uniref:hormogonium polysaccharide secretion pseudopilin HpsC n=1 Tax=Nostoc sp. FACHB-892 TaxID=2692843 RepID=UPI001683CB07|nr:hormogonium polysaccharide secretion pseudopilin HpsC [Nostoc sp. FACHB-892]MBD2730075.1 prepilin-type N-terminal cleavage/methylation domain-containing protein [Nostoc sp. FACHB-892]
MIRTLKFLLSNQLKRSKGIQQVDGFTLIELLVAMILAFLIITPLLGFMISILNTDRQEQAKANSEQEIQAALDYIARDLQQAIYIYDATGIGCLTGTADTITCPNAGTTGNQLPNPTATDRVPILVFWKRELVSQAITVGTQQDDTFVYSLVAYYLTKDTSTTWSNAARIARWQIRDGVPDSSNTQTCGKYLIGHCPSPGFALFKLDGIGTITQKMNSWTKATASYTADTTVLVDFIDQTKTDDVPETPSANCSPTSVPTSFNTRDTYKMTGFYACVDRVNTTAQVFIRGNALARMENDSNRIKYADSKKTYFPTASIRVQGRGYLFTK